MSSSVFKLVSFDTKQVILKVQASSNLVIAQHPYINANYDYITVTRGLNHVLTVVNKDGSTFHFSWGERGYTCISDTLRMLRSAVVNFIESKGLLLEIDTDTVDSAVIFFNPNFGKWQLTINDKACYWSSTAKTLEQMTADVSRFIKVSKWTLCRSGRNIEICVAEGSITFVKPRCSKSTK